MPAVPTLAAAWQAPLPHGGTTTELALWWSVFNDPVLTDLQQAAQQASPSLAAAKARVERARAALTGATALGLPTLDAVGSASAGRQPAAVHSRHTTSASAGIAGEARPQPSSTAEPNNSGTCKNNSKSIAGMSARRGKRVHTAASRAMAAKRPAVGRAFGAPACRVASIRPATARHRQRRQTHPA